MGTVTNIFFHFHSKGQDEEISIDLHCMHTQGCLELNHHPPKKMPSECSLNAYPVAVANKSPQSGSKTMTFDLV